ncbi:MAG TPA: acyltransferase domain-containing protein, partial [Thermoanaerobaculia bacterium]|nr:acyltransferase domain-containing protein [Thermoanaerobaculia bacterium]
SGPSRPWQLLLLSARTPTALDRATANLAGHLEAHPDLSLADAAFTLQVGRRALEHRRAVVVQDVADARAVLEGGDPRRVLSAWCEDRERGVVFLFSGMGGQYPDMGRGLYDSEPTFKTDVDRCAEILQPLLGLDLREVMYPAASSTKEVGEGTAGSVDLRKMLRRSGSGDDEAAARLNRTRFAQPALFVLEYALARLWMEWGIRPQAMMGYSLGEYVAACLAGVFSLEDALALVAERARLIEELPEGAMLAVSLPEAEAAALLSDELSLAAVNGPEQSVLAGPLPAVEELERDLASRGIACRRLQTTHAFHSKMMEPIRQAWAERVGRATLRPPQIPYISNVTGGWITADQATDPAFWAGHTCQAVRFSEGVAELRRDPDRVLLEIGPGATLASLVLQHPASKGKEGEEALVVAALRHSYETQPDVAYTLTALAKLWLAGVRVDWSGVYARERRHRLVLPTYPFERQRYWIDTIDATRGERRAASRALAREGAHLYLPSWRRAPLSGAGIPEPGRWLVFADGAGIGEAMAERLRGMGSDVALVHAGREEEPFTDLGGGDYRFDPRSAEAHATLFNELGRVPDRIVHLTSISSPSPTLGFLGFQSLAALAGALVGRGVTEPVRLWVIGDELHEVSGEEEPSPERTALLGAVKAIPGELPQVACRAVDVALPATAPTRERLLRQLLAELAADSPDRLVALRGNHRWAPAVEPLAPAPTAPAEGGLWLVSAGLGQAGFAFTRELAGANAKLLLLEPAGFPAREEWSDWLEGDADGVVGQLLRNARTLEEQGAELEVAGVDLADGALLREVVEAAEARWGTVRGTVWLAEPGTSEGHLAGALTGLRSLDALLATRGLTSALLVVPEGTPGAEAAALGFLADTFATGSALAGGTPWTSVAWALPPEEGATAAARRLLGGAGALQVLASPRPLPDGWSRLDTFPESEATARTGVGSYPRPSLRVEYVAPRNETEEYIARIWKDLLGVAQVGIHDNFLDLGGDSLLATRLVARMRDTFHLELPVRLFFEKSTVAELAEAVAALRQQEQERETEELLAKVQSLSEEELEQELLRMEGMVGEEEPARG